MRVGSNDTLSFVKLLQAAIKPYDTAAFVTQLQAATKLYDTAAVVKQLQAATKPYDTAAVVKQLQAATKPYDTAAFVKQLQAATKPYDMTAWVKQMQQAIKPLAMAGFSPAAGIVGNEAITVDADDHEGVFSLPPLLLLSLVNASLGMLGMLCSRLEDVPGVEVPSEVQDGIESCVAFLTFCIAALAIRDWRIKSRHGKSGTPSTDLS
jgi:hypothetical protein